MLVVRMIKEAALDMGPPEVSAGDMEQRLPNKYVLSRGAPTKPGVEESAAGTEQNPNSVMKDAPALPRREEFVGGMGQIMSKGVARKDAITTPSTEASAGDMEQRNGESVQRS